MDINNLIKKQTSYDSGYIFLPCTSLPVDVIYVWRYLLVIHPIMKDLIQDYIGKNRQPFRVDVEDYDNTLNNQVLVYNVGKNHYTHISNKEVSKVIERFIKDKQEEIKSKCL